MKDLIQFILQQFNMQIKRYPDTDIKRRSQLIDFYGISCIFDVGANAGQYSLSVRKFGYKGQIISFEPLVSAFEILKKKSSNDTKWTIFNFALGNENSTSTINISQNSYSSSIKNILPSHYNSCPESKYIDSHAIEIKRLDDIYKSIDFDDQALMLKIDTQGYELEVLKGASEFLKKVKVIQLEMSLIELYENEPLFLEVTNFLSDLGFSLVSLENGFYNEETGQLYQVDGIFAR